MCVYCDGGAGGVGGKWVRRDECDVALTRECVLVFVLMCWMRWQRLRVEKTQLLQNHWRGYCARKHAWEVSAGAVLLPLRVRRSYAGCLHACVSCQECVCAHLRVLCVPS